MRQKLGEYVLRNMFHVPVFLEIASCNGRHRMRPGAHAVGVRTDIGLGRDIAERVVADRLVDDAGPRGRLCSLTSEPISLKFLSRIKLGEAISDFEV